MKEELGLVLYTDGGHRPYGSGWGFHGYSYKVSELTDTTNKKVDAPTSLGYADEKTIKTDKGFQPVKKVENYYDAWGSAQAADSNNVMELTAAIRGLQLGRSIEAKKIAIRADAEYVLKGITEWSDKWLRSGWKRADGSDVPNQDLWKELISIKDELLESGSTIQWRWVKGHSGDTGNDMADRNATRGVILASKDIFLDNTFIEPVAGYWNPKNEYNRLFSCPHWYFMVHKGANQSVDGRHIYYTGNHDGKIEMAGKAEKDHCFAVLFLKELEPVLEAVKECQESVCLETYQDIIACNMNVTLSSKVYAEIAKHGCAYTIKPNDPKKADLFLWETPKNGGTQITEVVRPQRISQRVFEYSYLLESMLEEYLANKTEHYAVTDITSYFYDREIVKKKEVTVLKKDVGTSSKFIDVLANYKTSSENKETTLRLTLGLDLPTRNALSALAINEPKVTLLTWKESSCGIRYAVVIEVGDDASIWSSVHSNLKVIVGE